MKIKGLVNCAGSHYALSAGQTMIIDDETGHLLVRDGLAEVVEDDDSGENKNEGDDSEGKKDETAVDPAKSENPEDKQKDGKKSETATQTPPVLNPKK